MLTVGDLLAWKANRAAWRADCLALAETTAANLLEYRAWEREAATLYPEDNSDRVFVAEHSLAFLLAEAHS